MQYSRSSFNTSNKISKSSFASTTAVSRSGENFSPVCRTVFSTTFVPANSPGQNFYPREKPSHTQKNFDNPRSSSLPAAYTPSSAAVYLHKHRRTPSLSANSFIRYSSKMKSSNPEILTQASGDSSSPTSPGQQIPVKDSENIVPLNSSLSTSLHNFPPLCSATSLTLQARKASHSRCSSELSLSTPFTPSGQSNHILSSCNMQKPVIPVVLGDKNNNAPNPSSGNNSFTSTLHLNATTEIGNTFPNISPNFTTLIRKKSGELVKSALRSRSATNLSSSAVYTKAVHFNENIEQVRHFLQLDRPIALSGGGANTSLSKENDSFENQSYQIDEIEDVETPSPSPSLPPSSPSSSLMSSEYVSSIPEPNSSTSGIVSQTLSIYPWKPRRLCISPTNWPQSSPERLSAPVRLEKVYLSDNKHDLIGLVSVLNIAYHKEVSCRFTLDNWKTISEVNAEYFPAGLQQNATQNWSGAAEYDVFQFIIHLSDQTRLDTRLLVLCIRYSVDGKEFWDNNSWSNYHFMFFMSPDTQCGTTNFEDGLPQSSLICQNSSSISPANDRPELSTSLLRMDYSHRLNQNLPLIKRNISQLPVIHQPAHEPSETSPNSPKVFALSSPAHGLFGETSGEIERCSGDWRYSANNENQNEKDDSEIILNDDDVTDSILHMECVNSSIFMDHDNCVLRGDPDFSSAGNVITLPTGDNAVKSMHLESLAPQYQSSYGTVNFNQNPNNFTCYFPTNSLSHNSGMGMTSCSSETVTPVTTAACSPLTLPVSSTKSNSNFSSRLLSRFNLHGTTEEEVIREFGSRDGLIVSPSERLISLSPDTFATSTVVSPSSVEDLTSSSSSCTSSPLPSPTSTCIPSLPTDVRGLVRSSGINSVENKERTAATLISSLSESSMNSGSLLGFGAVQSDSPNFSRPISPVTCFNSRHATTSPSINDSTDGSPPFSHTTSHLHIHESMFGKSNQATVIHS